MKIIHQLFEFVAIGLLMHCTNCDCYWEIEKGDPFYVHEFFQRATILVRMKCPRCNTMQKEIVVNHYVS